MMECGEVQLDLSYNPKILELEGMSVRKISPSHPVSPSLSLNASSDGGNSLPSTADLFVLGEGRISS